SMGINGSRKHRKAGGGHRSKPTGRVWQDRAMTRLAMVYAAVFNAAAGAALAAHAQVHQLPAHHHHHHRFSGSPVGYAGLAAASVASWIGLPGPGEPLLIAAGIL